MRDVTDSSKKRRGGGLARKFVSCLAVAGLAASLGAGAAFATDQTSTTYALPKADEVKSFQHEGTDANGNKYTYEYVTIGSSATGRVAPMAQTYYEVLGLNYVNAYRGPDSIFNDPNAGDSKKESSEAHSAANGVNETYTTGSAGALQTRNSTLAIMGSSNNEAADEYIWNYCAWANGATLSADKMAVDHGNGTTGAISVSVGGTEYKDFPREVYMECNLIGQESSAATYNDGDSYLKWIERENARQNRPKTGTYNPYFAKYSVASGGGYTMVEGLHTLANTIDSVVAQSRDANGNYTLQSRYGGNSATGTGAAIDKYEDLVQATQYYTLSQLAANNASQKVTAVLVGYDPATGNYACRKYAVKDKDQDSNVYGGRVAGYLASISKSITTLGLKEAQQPHSDYTDSKGNTVSEKEYVAWYTPEQIVANCDAAFICDAPSANNISTYLATSSDSQCHVVYSPATVGSPEEDNRAGLTAARNAAVAAGNKAANFCFSYPANMFGNFYAQGVENGMLALITSSFTYPDYFGTSGLTDLLAYWAKYVWHIKDDSLQSVVEGTCSYMDMTGLSIGTISTDFEKNAENFFVQGNSYYIQHQAAIDGMVYGNLKTYDTTALASRTLNSVANTVASMQQQLADSNSDAAATKTSLEAAQKSLEEAQAALAASQASDSSNSAALAAANTALAQAQAALTTSSINKKTLKASDIPATATSVVIGKKVTKIAPKAFKGTKVTTVIVSSTKLKKAKVKNCLKGSKVKTIQVPSSKLAAYKKIFTKKNAGKKVTVS